MDGKVTAQAIGKYERGESIPSSGVLVAMAKALGVSLNYLLDTQQIELQAVEFRTKADTSARERAHVETEVLEWIDLAARYDSQQLMDVVFTVGQYRLVSAALNTLCIQLDGYLRPYAA